jgi:predicted DCC family thiol-disulfide oxidoreductase YuxK
VPRPRNSAAGEADSGAGWFALVPAYRLATLRVALAVTTLVFHVPKFNGLIDRYVASAFHVPPALPWIPPLTPLGGAALIALQHVAAWGLLLGLGPRLCAWFLAAAGFYIILLDPEHYAHNAQFHLTLLALVGCSSDRVSLPRLLRADDAGERCPAWPERLVRIQLCIVFSYAALSKIFSPHWGLSGTLLAAQRVTEHGLGLGALQKVNQTVIRAFPAAMSVVTTALEFFLAVAFLCRPLWRAGIVVAFVFVVYLEFLLRPGVFAWDVLAALLVLVPAGDQSWTVFHDPECSSCRWNRAMLSRLDWLRRLRWVPTADAVGIESRPALARDGARMGLHLVSPRGREYRGFDAFRVLPVILPGPVFVVMAVARFGGGFLAGRGHGPWYDLPYLVLGGLLVLWMPGVARFVGRPLYAAVAAAWDHHLWRGGPAVRGADGACRAHARGRA